MEPRRNTSSNIPKIIGLIIGGYALFAALVIAFYDPAPVTPAEMDWEDRQLFNQNTIAGLSLGDAKKQVMETLGAPNFNDAQIVDGVEMQLVRYRTHHVRSDGETTEDECTPLLFVSGKLVGIGDHAVETYMNNGLPELPQVNAAN
ncbi:DUF3192 domain-containing protein [Ferrimonas sediminicola]|uniref:DUF3192 domain-containing protein n=1 Tax=Ferrimonas sediminicola TaxID=2569538 RepID=A0A4V5NYB6_9GAMM|nr:DUF3192 domain-containing protein [Ferrimonas sediminicola]TKB49454.1 DUF3192 domain-containing protein [Ferrimonas sediminicola]